MSEQPRIKRAGLGAQFKGAGSDRASGLNGLLPPAPPRSRAATAEQPGTDVELGEQTNEAKTPRTARRVEGTRAPRASSAAKTGPQNVTVYLEPEVFAAVRIARRDGVQADERDKTYDELLVEALDKVGIDALQAHFVPVESRAGGLLQARSRASGRTATVQRQVRLDAAQIAALDELAGKVGAKDRTTLINGAYRLAYLGR